MVETMAGLIVLLVAMIVIFAVVALLVFLERTFPWMFR